jgi:hypothetical protein
VHEQCSAHTWRRALIVDEVRGAPEEFCQFAGAPQELLALVRGEGVRGRRGLWVGDDWMGHGRRAVGRRRRSGGCERTGRLLWEIAIIAITGTNTKAKDSLGMSGAD